MKLVRVIIEDGLDVCVKTLDEAVSEILKYYETKSKVCIGELLSYTQIHGVSIDKLVDVYGYIMSKVENDILIHLVEGEGVTRCL